MSLTAFDAQRHNAVGFVLVHPIGIGKEFAFFVGELDGR